MEKWSRSRFVCRVRDLILIEVEMSILEILYRIKQTNSRKEKEKIIIKNDSKLLQKIFQYTYEPLKVFYIQEIPESLRISNGKNLQIENIQEIIFDLFDKLSTRIFTGNNARDKIVEICNNVSLETFDLILSILRKDLGIGIGEKTILKIYGEGFITNFGIQLANLFNFAKCYKNKFWIGTPKLNGIRGVLKNEVFLSRRGKQLQGFEKIDIQLQYMAKEYGLGLIDGELYSKDVPFQQLQSIVMQSKNIDVNLKDKINYYIFAIDLKDKKFKNAEMMYKFINEIKKRNEFENIYFLKPFVIENDLGIIENFRKNYISRGYEGVIMRDNEEYISSGRSDKLLKLKEFDDIDMKIIDMEEGKGKLKEKMGALLCKCIVNGNEILSKVGSGFDDTEREIIYNNFEKYKNKILTVRFKEFTDNFKSLRDPRKLAFKEDR